MEKYSLWGDEGDGQVEMKNEDFQQLKKVRERKEVIMGKVGRDDQEKIQQMIQVVKDGKIEILQGMEKLIADTVQMQFNVSSDKEISEVLKNTDRL